MEQDAGSYRRYLDDRVILADQIYTARGEGKLEGRAEGREEGRAEGVLAVARKMKEKNMSVDDIIAFTGLTTEDIERL